MLRRTASPAPLLVSLLLATGCYVETSYGPPPNTQAQVDMQPPPQQTVAQVDVNAQAQPVDTQAQPVDPNAQAPAQTTDQVADTDASAVNDFRDVLAPYGTWVDDPQYGTIWLPNQAVVGADFQPYMSAGHWVYDSDYTWVSDWDWGWAPFHYGRWFAMPGRGWAWIPGKEYAGAWVTWRNGDDGYGYVGWAPTAPAYYWRGGAAVTIAQPWFAPRYSYIETGNLFQPTFRVNVIRDPGRVAVIEQRTRVYAPSGSVVVGGNTRMQVRGPAPAHLGLNASTLPRAPANNASFTRAYNFAHTRNGQPVGQTVTPGHPAINGQAGNTTAQQQHGMQQPQQQQPQRTQGSDHVLPHGQVDEHPGQPVPQQQMVQQQRPGVVQPTPTAQRRPPTPPPNNNRHR